MEEPVYMSAPLMCEDVVRDGFWEDRERIPKSDECFSWNFGEVFTMKVESSFSNAQDEFYISWNKSFVSSYAWKMRKRSQHDIRCKWGTSQRCRRNQWKWKWETASFLAISFKFLLWHVLRRGPPLLFTAVSYISWMSRILTIEEQQNIKNLFVTYKW